VDFAALAGLMPAGVICEILSDDGKMARLPELIEFKARHGLPLVSIAALIEYRHRREQLVEEVATRPFASEYGEFQLHVFRSKVDGRHHLAFTKGRLDASPTLVRVHTENLLSDVFHATDMGSHRSLLASLERVAKAGHGVIVYMEQTGRMQEALLSAGQPAANATGPPTCVTTARAPDPDRPRPEEDPPAATLAPPRRRPRRLRARDRGADPRLRFRLRPGRFHFALNLP